MFLSIQELTKTQKPSQTHIETHFEQQTHGQKLKNTTYNIYTHGGRDQNNKNNQSAPIKLNISAANERGHQKEEIAPIESKNKQVEQKWVIWNEGKMDLCG